MQIGEVFQVDFAAAIDRLLRTDALLSVAADDPEVVHRARTAVRQARALLRTFRPILDVSWSIDLDERMRRLNVVFGAARNADVLLANLRRHQQRLPSADAPNVGRVLAAIESDRAEAYAALVELVRSPLYIELLEAVAEAVRRPAFGETASKPAREAVPELMNATWRKLRKAALRLSAPPTDAELHRMRIKIKRARYAAQAAAPVAGDAAETFARHMKSFQAVLGRQHDAVFACARLREIGTSSELAFVAGELVALENAANRKQRRKWHKAWRRMARRSQDFGPA